MTLLLLVHTAIHYLCSRFSKNSLLYGFKMHYAPTNLILLANFSSEKYDNAKYLNPYS